jgi:hypothetical protein
MERFVHVLVALLLLLQGASAYASSAPPEQLRLALTGTPPPPNVLIFLSLSLRSLSSERWVGAGAKGEMLVGWTTAHDTKDSTVEYTCSGCGYFVAQGHSTHIPPTAPGYTAPQLHCTPRSLALTCLVGVLTLFFSQTPQ